MLSFLYKKFVRRTLLTLIVISSLISFYYNIQSQFFLWTIIALGVVSIIFVMYEIAPIFLLIFSSFTVSYSLYGLLFQMQTPIWAIMLIILLIFGYIFLYTEQRIGILGDKRLIYLVLFSLIILEIFLTLNYFLISPISKSLIISIISYVFVGFAYTVLAQHKDNLFRTYLLFAVGSVALILATSVWGI